ncbi:histone-lysine N-methyltransferase SETMAR [Trichonephila clavipes]|nr:histone-lysine N-methyltransferase SETMAR [Trichonephila clavipes]
MDDETYMPFYDVPIRQESKIWVFKDDPMPTMAKSQRAIKKVMYAIFFRSTGLIKAIKLEEQKTVTAKCASSHTAGLTSEFLKQKQIKVIEHAPYSPVLAIWDFWLFTNLKKNFRGRRLYSEEDIDVAINAFFINSKK